MIKQMPLVVAVLFLIAPAVAADDGGYGPPPGCPFLLAQSPPGEKMAEEPEALPPGPLPSGMHRPGGRGGRYLEQFRVLKLLELLDLSEDQEGSFIARYRQLRKNLDRLEEKKREQLKELAEGLKTDKVSDKEINEHIAEITGLEESKRQEMSDFIADARKLLDPRQLGKLFIFQERFEFELLDRVRIFRERGISRNASPDEHNSEGDF